VTRKSGSILEGNIFYFFIESIHSFSWPSLLFDGHRPLSQRLKRPEFVLTTYLVTIFKHSEAVHPISHILIFVLPCLIKN
jgi:hypothetical protein